MLGSGQSVLITSHRRESWGAPMGRTANAIARLAKEFPDVSFLLPAHLNPVVREVLLPPLEGMDNVTITEPLSYADFARAMDRCTLLLTDSGGVQEEAPSLGKPVLVLRDTTERPEAVDAGTVRLVGTDEDLVVKEVSPPADRPVGVRRDGARRQPVRRRPGDPAHRRAPSRPAWPRHALPDWSHQRYAPCRSGGKIDNGRPARRHATPDSELSAPT